MISYKLGLLVLLLGLSIFSVKATEDCDPATCYTTAAKNVLTEIEAASKAQNDFVAAEQKVMDQHLINLATFQKTIEDYAKKISDRAKAIEDRGTTLTNQVLDLEKECDAISKQHESFSVQNSEVSSVLTEESRKEKNNNMYLPRDAIVYQEVLGPNKKILVPGVSKVGNPPNWDDFTYHEGNKWNGRSMFRIGINEAPAGSGLQINAMPSGMSVLWLRHANHVWCRVKVTCLVDGKLVDFKETTMGYRNLNNYAPDGGPNDSFHLTHTWFAIRLNEKCKNIIITPKQNTDTWVSGIAYSKNLWNHAYNSAVAYHWAINGGTNADWETHNWNNDQLIRVMNGRLHKFIVPVVSNGKDKLVYLIEHNNNWLGTMHGTVRVNGKTIERFRTSYSNPFATNANSKIFSRYMAAYIPAEIIPKDALMIELEIDMTQQNHNLYLREIGTHDTE